MTSFKEKSVLFSEHPEILALYKKRHPCYTVTIEEEFKYAYIVFLDASPPFYLLIMPHSKNYLINYDNGEFQKFYENLPGKNFFDLLYLVTLYPKWLMGEHFSTHPFRLPSFERENLVDELLSASYGRLVYHFQLTQLFRIMTGADEESADKFRRDIGNHIPEAVELTKKISLPAGETLEEIMKERMIYEFTCFPHYREAALLYSIHRIGDSGLLIKSVDQLRDVLQDVKEKKNDFIKKTKYEEGARLRDQEKEIMKVLELKLWDEFSMPSF